MSELRLPWRLLAMSYLLLFCVQVHAQIPSCAGMTGSTLTTCQQYRLTYMREQQAQLAATPLTNTATSLGNIEKNVQTQKSEAPSVSVVSGSLNALYTTRPMQTALSWRHMTN